MRRDFCHIKSIDGRKFILKWPHYGPDTIFLPVATGHRKPCKIIGIAKSNAKEGIYLEEEIQCLIDNIDED